MTYVKQNLTEYTDINIITRYPNWNVANTYAFGDIIFFEHYYYRSVIDNNTGVTPSEDSTEWLLWSVSNRYAQIDLHANTKTIWDSTTALNIADGGLITDITGSFNAICLGRVRGAKITITIKHTNPIPDEVFTKNINSNIDEFLIFTPKDPFEMSSATVKITAHGGIGGGLPTASVGYLLAGAPLYLADTLYGFTNGIENNSIVTVDDFGIETVTYRESNEVLEADIIFDTKYMVKIKKEIQELRDEVVLWIGEDNNIPDPPIITPGSIVIPNNILLFEGLMVLGRAQDFMPVVSNPTTTQASLSIKETL